MTAEQIGTVIERCRTRTRSRLHTVVEKALPDILHGALVRS